MLLALDTSTRTVGVAIYNGVSVLGETIWSSHDYHTVELAPKVAEMLLKCGVKTSDLEVIAVAIGPGSFTGLRIGLSLAKGLTLVHHKPIVGIPTLDILAAAQPLGGERLVAVLRAGRGRLAAGWYQGRGRKWQAEGNIELVSAEELVEKIQKPTLVCGELTEEERRILYKNRRNIKLASPAQSLRRPSYLAELGWRRWQAGEVDNPATLSPFYLHTSGLIPGG
jgi:tRNA threonylcarbamoyladenosine biosynthesis protein TsaB